MLRFNFTLKHVLETKIEKADRLSKRLDLSSSQTVDLVFSLFYFLFLFLFCFIFYFLFLEQLGLGLIGHAVTSVTTWWCSHKMDHKTWKNLVKNSRTNDVIQHGHHMVV